VADILLNAEVQPHGVGALRELTRSGQQDLVATRSGQTAIAEQPVPPELSGSVGDPLEEDYPCRTAGAAELDAQVRGVRRQYGEAQPLGSRIDRIEGNGPDAEAEGQPPRLAERRYLGRRTSRPEVHERIALQRSPEIHEPGVAFAEHDERGPRYLYASTR
jgi:hypothetical protein